MSESVVVREVRQFFAAQGLGNRPGVVACSGGPDSSALLYALVDTFPRESLCVAHLNHQLRGAASDEDESFVLSEAARLGVAVESARRGVGSAAAATGDNLEAVARRVRYQWLAEVALRRGAAWLATGHTANDQAETVLFNLLRGAGLRGLRGIAPRRKLAPGVEVVRPILQVRRDDVEVYLHQRGVKPRQDFTNLDLRLARNRLRWQLLPMLAEQFGPHVVEHLCQTAEQVRGAYVELEARALSLLVRAEKPRADAVIVLDLAVLAAAPRDELREMFRCLWDRETWPAGEMTFSAWDRLAGLAAGVASAVDLPGRLRARRAGNVLQIWRAPCHDA